jgi:hypothetical protein
MLNTDVFPDVRSSEWQWVWKGGQFRLVRLYEELLERRSSDSGLENVITVVGNRRADHAKPAKVGTVFPAKWRPHCRYSPFSD